MMEALLNALLHTDSQRQFAEQQVAAIRMDLIERPAKFEAIEHLGADTFTKQEIERFVGKKLRRQGQRPIRKPQAIENHPGHGFTRCNLLLLIGNDACVDHTDQSQVFYHRGYEPQVIQAFNMDRLHLYPSPESSRVVRRGIQRKVKDFFSLCTCSMSACFSGRYKFFPSKKPIFLMMHW